MCSLQEEGLSITSNANNKTVDFLEVTTNIPTTPLNNQKLPAGINKRLSSKHLQGSNPNISGCTKGQWLNPQTPLLKAKKRKSMRRNPAFLMQCENKLWSKIPHAEISYRCLPNLGNIISKHNNTKRMKNEETHRPKFTSWQKPWETKLKLQKKELNS